MSRYALEAMWGFYIFGGVAALFAVWAVFTLWHLRWVQRLPSLKELEGVAGPKDKPVRVSIVIAARDEEARIEQTVRRLLIQTGIEAEFIIVDDRSRDRTGEILRRLAKEDPRVQIKRVDTLPEGWLGKCHACHIGASAATGEWILFTDADCWSKPDLIERALCVARREQADHITLVSGMAGGTIWLKASQLLFVISLANWFSAVNRDRPKSFLGIGAFNFVRAAAYRECGGYEALRLTVLDDVKLGLLLRRAGKRTRAFLGGNDVECHWGQRAFEMVKIMEKNYFAALDYRLELAIGGSLFVVAIFVILGLGLLSGTLPGILAVCSPLTLILPGAVVAARLKCPLYTALCVPFVIPLFLICLFNSAFRTLQRGGIRWRETFYPLDVLRAGNVQ